MSKNIIVTPKGKYKNELAEDYGWKRQTLMARINKDAQLMKQLTNLGYEKWQRMFTPKQLNAIFIHLGKPE